MATISQALKQHEAAHDLYAEALVTFRECRLALEKAVCEQLKQDIPCADDDPLELVVGGCLVTVYAGDFRPNVSVRPIDVMEG
jgi:hypothetical protein